MRGLLLTLLIACQIMISAQAKLDIVITEGIDSARPIAVVPFVWETASPATVPLEDVIANDLMRSGKFNPLKLSDMPQLPSSLQQINFDTWAEAGVEMIVIGKVREIQSQRYAVTYQLLMLFAVKQQKWQP